MTQAPSVVRPKPSGARRSGGTLSQRFTANRGNKVPPLASLKRGGYPARVGTTGDSTPTHPTLGRSAVARPSLWTLSLGARHSSGASFHALMDRAACALMIMTRHWSGAPPAKESHPGLQHVLVQPLRIHHVDTLELDAIAALGP